jgi:hypothetical protein
MGIIGLKQLNAVVDYCRILVIFESTLDSILQTHIRFIVVLCIYGKFCRESKAFICQA